MPDAPPCLPTSLTKGFAATILLRVSIAGLLPGFILAQENALKVAVDSDSSRNTTIGVFRQREVLYGSVTDLAAVFSLATFENQATGKLEIKQPPYRVKVSGNNPFIVITDQSNRQTVYQLPVPVVSAAKTYFVPLGLFVPFFNSVFRRDATYDASGGILRIRSFEPSREFDIPSISLEQKANGMLIRVPSEKPLKEFESWLRKDGWLYVTIADARADIDAINALRPVGLIKKIVAIQSPTSLQLTFKLDGKVAASEIIKPEDSNDILIAIRTPGAEDRLLLERKRREIQADLENQRRRWELDVIVIDPGHGGRDFGALGVTGVREKDITLGIALKLGRLIRKNLKGVKVVYTRTDDSFVELDRRGQIANEASGKLFISIHSNALPRKPSGTRGFEVYLLRPGRTEEAISIAERENAVIRLEEGYEQRYQELTEENFILVAMAQSAHVKASELFADIAQQEMEDRLEIPNRGVKQAGFYVLVGAAMPNVLIETAYLSNREDERFLKSESGQQRIAESLFKAIKRYKDEYEKLLGEGKEIGER
jgi:N-acetylmuramoyl-L-alanine amidase